MFEYLIEKDVYITTFWKLSWTFCKHDFNDNDIVQITRTDNNGRHFELKITRNQITYNIRKHTCALNHNIDFNKDNNNCELIWKSFNECELIINDSSWNLGEVYCSDTTTIKSTIEILDYDIKYLNLNSEIPRVYSGCFGNLHTHECFGRYCYDNGANYYNYGKSKISMDLDNMLNRLVDDYHSCPNNKIYIFMTGLVKNKNAINTFNTIIKKLKNSSVPLSAITFCTVSLRDEKCSIWNSLVSKYNHIDFSNDFNNLDNIIEYFKDAGHTNKEGAKLLYERIKQDAPDLCKQYTINFNN